MKLHLAAVHLGGKYTLCRVHLIDIGFPGVVAVTVLTSGPRTVVSAGGVLVAVRMRSWYLVQAIMPQASLGSVLGHWSYDMSIEPPF